MNIFLSKHMETLEFIAVKKIAEKLLFSSVPDPDPPDPHVLEPSGSGSISQRCGSGSFYHQAKVVRKTLIPTV
jgi:hypothetical protein